MSAMRTGLALRGAPVTREQSARCPADKNHPGARLNMEQVFSSLSTPPPGEVLYNHGVFWISLRVSRWVVGCRLVAYTKSRRANSVTQICSRSI
jgi:hypothetical protein